MIYDIEKKFSRGFIDHIYSTVCGKVFLRIGALFPVLNSFIVAICSTQIYCFIPADIKLED